MPETLSFILPCPPRNLLLVSGVKMGGERGIMGAYMALCSGSLLASPGYHIGCQGPNPGWL